MLDDMRGLLQAADEKRQASIAELSAKHQKVFLCSQTSILVPFAYNKFFLTFPSFVTIKES